MSVWPKIRTVFTWRPKTTAMRLISTGLIIVILGCVYAPFLGWHRSLEPWTVGGVSMVLGAIVFVANRPYRP